ncbi:MAG: tetratricopeptide repeat protein [Desulfoplanes sp.]|nr:tetratricopeptide repeat protein [Desulfoplanes sp.]
MQEARLKRCMMMSGRIFRPLIIVCVLTMLYACLGHGTETAGYNKAEQAFERGEYRLAEKLYQNYVQQNPSGNQRWEAWQRLVFISRDIANNHLAAQELLETMYLEFRTDPTKATAIRMQQIELYKATDDLENAITTIDNALNIQGLSNQKKWNLLFTKGTLALRVHQYGLAKTSFNKALGYAFNEQSRSRTLNAKGQALTFMHEYEQARQVLQQAFTETTPGPTWSRIGFALAEIAEHQGRYKDGVQLLNTIRKHYPNPKALDIRLQALKKHLNMHPSQPQ